MLLILLIGLIFSLVLHSVVFLLIFINMRRYTGGYHEEVYITSTDPTKKDTDGDELEDDDEFKFNCDPNKKDTDNNGIIDGKEKHQQTLDVVPDNKEQAVTKVSVSMAASGNIE